MNKLGKIILVSGPSGVGKKTILDELRKNDSLNINSSISMTTRPQREDEIDGVDYFFKTKHEFQHAIENDELIEYEKFCDNYYGTPKHYVLDMLKMGKNVLLEIEVKGAKNIMKKFSPDQVISIFIVPPSLDELKNRLLNRNTESIEKINQRIEIAKIELMEQSNYQHIIINDNVVDAINNLTKIIRENQ